MTTSNPITEARASIPEWMLNIHDFDGIEIDPLQIVGYDDDGTPYFEPCLNGEKPNMWGVFLSLKAGGRESISDHQTEAEAQAEAARLENAWPHLDPNRNESSTHD